MRPFIYLCILCSSGQIPFTKCKYTSILKLQPRPYNNNKIFQQYYNNLKTRD